MMLFHQLSVSGECISTPSQGSCSTLSFLQEAQRKELSKISNTGLPCTLKSYFADLFSCHLLLMLGPTERDDACATCGQSQLHCPGHMGHIELPLTVFNPVFFNTLYKVGMILYLIYIFFFFFFFFLIQFNVPFKIISAHMRRGQSVGGVKTGEPREKPPDTPASRTWLVSHVARAGLEPTPNTAVRRSNGNFYILIVHNIFIA